MLDGLLSLAARSPAGMIALGRAIFSIAGVLAVLGMRFDRLAHRVERMSAKVGIVSPDVLAALPWWLRAFVPESPLGWIGVGLLCAVGIALVQLGKWARKL